MVDERRTDERRTDERRTDERSAGEPPEGKAPDTEPWRDRRDGLHLGGPGFARYIEAMRRAQDLVAGTNPPPGVVLAATRSLNGLNALLEPFAATEDDTPSGSRTDLPGRGHPLLLPLLIDAESEGSLRGRVTFGRFHLGRGGAAHGGTIPLLFDDLLGRVANPPGRGRARTARLTVHYRQITPIDVELEVEATRERSEGRKQWVRGRLLRDGAVLSSAEGLFVTLRPGQP